MKRKLIDRLSEWKEKNKDGLSRPVLITGARGVGKTYLSFDFGRSFYQDIIYINFERNGRLKRLFYEEQPEIILDKISDHFHKPLNKDTILILDEIGYCEEGIQFILQVKEHKLPVNIIGITSKSLDYISLREELEGCVEHMALYPFDFEEYLWATGYEWYSDVIREHFAKNKKIPDIVHNELLNIFEQYMNVGGFPRVINEYMNTEMFINISEQQNSIMESFYADAGNKDDSLYVKIKSILSTMDMQIGKKNKKFQYKLIRKGATKNLYIDGIHYMNKSNIVIKVDKLNSDQFKLYLCDAGLQASMILEGNNEITKEDYRHVRKGLIENCIAQNLIPHYPKIYFWESNAQAKIDFIIKDELNMIPVEVSADTNTRTKSLSIFKSTYNVRKSIKISANNFGFRNNIKYIPFYAVFCLGEKY